LSAETGLSVKAIKKNLKLLKNENRIKRIGPDKDGHWDVVE
jgi:predicted HTH transcriptional regulator